MNGPLIAACELCQRLSISRATLRRILNRGEIGGYRVGGRVLFSEADVQAYLVGARIDPVRRTALSAKHK